MESKFDNIAETRKAMKAIIIQDKLFKEPEQRKVCPNSGVRTIITNIETII